MERLFVNQSRFFRGASPSTRTLSCVWLSFCNIRLIGRRLRNDLLSFLRPVVHQFLTPTKVSLMGLFIVVDLFTNLDDFTQQHHGFFDSLKYIGLYYGNMTPRIFDRLCEAIVLLAAMFTVAMMQRNNELLPLLSAGVCLSGVYGGYFGAAQGVLVIGLLGSFLDETLQRVTGAKNVLVAMVNGTAAVVFVALAHVSWAAVALLAAGSTAGGLLGARYGRRLPPAALRLLVAAIGVISAAKLIFF